MIPIIPPRSRKWTHTNPRKTGLNGILLGPVLKDLRHRAGLTQEQTSTLSSIPRAYIAKIELGSLSPGPKIVVSFCKALGIRVHDLIFCAESQWEPIMNTEILGYACLLSQDEVIRVIAECNGYIRGNIPVAHQRTIERFHQIFVEVPLTDAGKLPVIDPI